MSYFEFDDVRRIHMPYEDGFYRSKLIHCPNPVSSFSLETPTIQLTLPELEACYVLHIHSPVCGK